MVLVATELPALKSGGALSLPALGRGVPRRISLGSPGATLLKWIKARHALGLAWHPPGDTFPASVEAWLQGMLVAAGWCKPARPLRGPWAQTIWFGETTPYGNNAPEMFLSLRFDAEERFYLPRMHRMHAAVPGLSSWILAQLGATFVPGLTLPEQIFDCYVDYRLGGYSDDEGAAHFLVEEFEYDESSISDMLPSVVKATLGGDVFVYPAGHSCYAESPTIYRLVADLTRAGVKNAQRLAELLLKDLPTTSAKADSWRNRPASTSLTNAAMVFVGELDPGSATYQFLDELYQGDMGDGEEDRGEVNIEPAKTADPLDDELCQAAALLNMWQVIGEILNLLEK